MLFSGQTYKVEKTPGSPNEVVFYKLSSPELGDLLEIEAYSVSAFQMGGTHFCSIVKKMVA